MNTQLASRTRAFVFVIVAALALLLAWAPKAYADDIPCQVFVSGVAVTSDNASDVLGDGTVSFDAETNTLTLENASITMEKCTPVGNEAVSAGIYEFGYLDFTIKLVGENSITYAPTTPDDPSAYGIITLAPEGTENGGQVYIKGDGSLKIAFSPMLAYPDIYGTPADGDTYATAIAISAGYNRMIFDGGCKIVVTIGDSATPVASECEFFSGYIFDMRDADIVVHIGHCASAYGITCGSAYMSGGRISVVLDAGKGIGYCFSSGILDMSVDADASFVATITEAFGCGVSGGSLTVSDDAKLVAAAIAPDGAPIATAVSIGISMGTMTFKDNSTIVATGPIAAIIGGTLTLSDHAQGTASVSMQCGLPVPDGVVEWDGVTPLLQRSDTPYLYVRIPGESIVDRIAGDYANETAAAISRLAFPGGSEWVVIARDDDFADALGATGLAGVLECPIVLTDRMALSDAAAAEIERLGATNAYVIGGTGAIMEQVDTDLEALGVTKIERLWGENSYDTSLACAKKIVELGAVSEGAVIAMSTNFQDALSFSPIAYRFGLPVILQTWGDTSADRGFTDEAAAWLEGKTLTVVGGPGAISDASIEGYNLFKRVYGETGYDTSNEIAKWATDEEILDDSAVVIACGAQAPKGVDALAGAALAGKLGCPILLVNGNDAIEPVDTTTIDGYFTDHAKNCTGVYFLGGAYVMPDTIVEKVVSLLA